MVHAKPRRKAAQDLRRSEAASSGWSQRLATIQALMARVQQQLQANATLRLSNPGLANELKAKAEQHLELLMQLAETEQAQQLGVAGAAPPDPPLAHGSRNVQQVLEDLELQLDLEQEAARTASPTAGVAAGSSASAGGSASGDEAEELSRRLLVAEAQNDDLLRKLTDAEAQLAAVADELAEHRELQMLYDKQCQDVYRLRMQLQQVQSQGTDTAAAAASAAKQHKQDLNWLMSAHRKEMTEAHKKNQELITESQQLRLKLLEQEQLLWGQDETRGTASTASTEALQQQEHLAEQVQLQQRAEAAAEQQAQLQHLTATAEQLAAEKQQLLRSLQEAQREQAVLRVELQQLRDAAEAAGSSAATEAAAAAAEAAQAASAAEEQAALDAALEQQLIAALQAAEQQRDDLLLRVQALESSLQEAREAAAAAATAAPPAPAPAPAPVVPVQQGEAAAAIEQLKDAKMQMAKLRVQLADTRRELQHVAGRAEAAEAALQAQAADFEARLSKLQAWYGKQAAVVAALRKGKAPVDGQVGFTNAVRYWAKQEQLYEFLKHLAAREAVLQQAEGFLGLQVQPVPGITPDGGSDIVVSSLWESIPAWEAWAGSVAAQKLHLPAGVYQYVPKRGEGFAESFVPFRDLDAAVDAKYK